MLIANKKAGPKPRCKAPTDLIRPHPQNSLSLPVTYLRKEAVANACGPLGPAAGEPVGVRCSLQFSLSIRQPLFVVPCTLCQKFEAYDVRCEIPRLTSSNLPSHIEVVEIVEVVPHRGQKSEIRDQLYSCPPSSVL